jgi:hypothetical protein
MSRKRSRASIRPPDPANDDGDPMQVLIKALARYAVRHAKELEQYVPPDDEAGAADRDRRPRRK